MTEYININGICRLTNRCKSSIIALMKRHPYLKAVDKKELDDAGVFQIRTFKYYRKEDVVEWFNNIPKTKLINRNGDEYI